MEFGSLIEVAVADIEVGAYEVRMREEDEELVSLAASIRADGLMVPLIVRTKGDGWELVAGHRRLAACRLAGLERVTARAVLGDEGACERISIAENEFRRAVSPVERAHQIERAYATGVMGIEELAAAYGRSVAWVEGQIEILGWPERIQGAVHNGKMGVGVARQLAKVTDDAYREVLVTAALESGCTERTAAGWVAGFRAMEPALDVAAKVVEYDGSGARVVVPTAVCPGCREEFRPDAMVPVLLCMACQGTLRGG